LQKGKRKISRSLDWINLLGWLGVPALLLVIWQIAAVRLDKPWIFPPVSKVLAQLAHPLRDHYASGSLLSNALISLFRVLIGFAVASVVAISLGILMGSVRWFRALLEPTLEIIRPLSPIAWLPFAVVIFKLKTLGHLFGLEYTRTVLGQVQLGMLFVIFVGGFFPILINTIDGVAGVRRNYVILARSLGASPLQVFFYTYLPAAMPMILTGLRHGLARCWLVIIAAEMMAGTNSGIGYLLVYAADNSAMDIVIAAMFIIGALGALLGCAMRRIMSRVVRWHGKEI
jgi:NitT/TauT family transport system permease protein